MCPVFRTGRSVATENCANGEGDVCLASAKDATVVQKYDCFQRFFDNYDVW